MPAETAGVEAVLKGWSLARLPDAELERRGIALYDGLYTALAYRLAPRQEGGNNGTRTNAEERG